MGFHRVRFGIAAVWTAASTVWGIVPAFGQGAKARVVDETGKPLEGVEVFVQTRPHFPIPEEVKESTPTLTAADGSFSVPEDRPPGSLLVVRKPGFVARGFSADAAPPEEIELRAGDVLLGGVVNDKGVSVTGALIGPPIAQGQVSLAGHQTQPMLLTRSDAQGNFELNGVSKGRYEVLVQAPGTGPKLVTITSGVPKKVVLDTAGTTVTGTVRGSRDQAVKPGMYVEASAPGIRIYTRTDGDGRYTFPFLGEREWQFRAVVPETDVRHPVQTVGLKAQEEPYEVNLLLSQGIKVYGLVFDSETSEPISDMTMTLDTEPRRTTKSDSAGMFLFENVEQFSDPMLRWDGITYAYLDPVSGDERSYYEIPFPETGDETTVTLALRKRAFITGKVVDVFRRPVPGASVQARTLTGAVVRRGKNEEQAEYSARTKSDGTYKILISPAGKYELVAEKDEYVSEVATAESYTTAPADVTLELKASANLSGTVVDAEENPVIGATVEVRVAAEGGATAPELVGTGRVLKSARTGDRGLFELTGFTPRRVDVVAAHPDFGQKATTTVDAVSGTSGSITLKFPAGNAFSAILTRQDGGPVPSTPVRIFYTYGGQQRTTSGETDGTGRVEFKSIPSKQLDRVLVRDPQYVEFVAQNIDLPQKDYAITLKPRGSVAVTVDEVVAPADPTQLMTIMLLHAAGAEEGNTPQPSQFTVVERRETAEGKANFDSLDPGWYKAAAKRGSMYAESEATKLAEGTPTPLSVVMQAGGQVRGRVIDKQTQQPIPNAVVTLSLATAVVGVEPAKAVSSSDGTFIMTGLPAGASEVSVAASPYPDHTESVTIPSGGTLDLPILLSNEKAKLSGTVRYGSQGLSSALLVLHKVGEGENPIASAVSDGAGQYVFEQVPPGKYLMTVEGAASDGEELRHKQFDVTVTLPETTKDVSFQPMTKVTGRVRVEGLTQPPAGRAVLFMPKEAGSSASATITEAGTYEAHLEPGTYTVGLDDSPGKEVTIPATGDRPHNLDLSF